VTCLYLSDYGPPELGFDPLANGGTRIKGFEAHAVELAGARNLAQLEAMERALQRGDETRWCEQGYGWAYGDAVHALFVGIFVAVILPYAAIRLRTRLAGLAARVAVPGQRPSERPADA
jgi:hypothetical protein